MITGQPGPDFFAGIWNCTYIWPMVICCGIGARRALPGRRERDRRVLGDLGDAADEEAALVLEGDRAAHEPLLRTLRGDAGRQGDEQERDETASLTCHCSSLFIGPLC